MERSKLLDIYIENFACIGPEGLRVALDDILCLVGANNTGKSTVLRAYELAVQTSKLEAKDRCSRSSDKPTVVELQVHIPAGTPNIDERWIRVDGPHRIVRSRWVWKQAGAGPERCTWDPSTENFAEDGKASGLDNVFSSRLPKPFRIGSLDDPTEEEQNLLKLILQPITAQLRKSQDDPGSALHVALKGAAAAAREALAPFDDQLQGMKGQLDRRLQDVFPNLSVRVKLEISDAAFDLVSALAKSSAVHVEGADGSTRWNQQGTGAQRALFWSLLAVRSEILATQKKQEVSKKKELAAEKARKDAGTADEKRADLEAQLNKTVDPKQRKAIEAKLKKLQSKSEAEEPSTEATDIDVGLPSYMLLIDEPETALHPNAVRAARDYLYGLASDPSWQVMLTTHSPVFIDPTRDHTTVVRLDRTEAVPTPRVFRADDLHFTEHDRDRLKMLLKFDSGLAEMFFGGFPIIVEGDTEFAAFDAVMEAKAAEYPPATRPLIVRARGKDAICLIIRIAGHFKLPFAVLHDVDRPLTKALNESTAWSANYRIHTAVESARPGVPHAVHLVSTPDFEREHGLEEHKTEKPWRVREAVRSRPEVLESVHRVLRKLMTPGTAGTSAAQYSAFLREALGTWAKQHAPDDPTYVIPESDVG